MSSDQAIISRLSRLKKKELFKIIEEQFKKIESLEEERNLIRAEYEGLQKEYLSMKKEVERMKEKLSRPVVITKPVTGTEKKLETASASDLLILAWKTGALKKWLNDPSCQGSWDEDE